MMMAQGGPMYAMGGKYMDPEKAMGGKYMYAAEGESITRKPRRTKFRTKRYPYVR